MSLAPPHLAGANQRRRALRSWASSRALFLLSDQRPAGRPGAVERVARSECRLDLVQKGEGGAAARGRKEAGMTLPPPAPLPA